MCHSNLKIIGAAIEAYSEDHGRYPTHLNLLSPNYLDTVPTCQEAWDRAYSYEVQFSKQYYWFQCRKHRGWEPEECRRKLARLNEIESAAPSDIGPENQSNKLTCPSGGDPYLYVPHPGVFKLYCQGKNHREVPRDSLSSTLLMDWSTFVHIRNIDTSPIELSSEFRPLNYLQPRQSRRYLVVQITAFSYSFISSRRFRRLLPHGSRSGHLLGLLWRRRLQRM